MLGVDTNVLVRFLTRDEPEQFALAKSLIARAGPDGLFLGLLVLAELHWVLSKAYRMPKADILDVIEGLMDSREFVIDRRELVLEAIEGAKRSGGDFADALIGLVNLEAGCARTATFDKEATRLPQMTPVQDLLS